MPAALALICRLDPSIVFEFDANLPRAVTSGFHPVERTPDESFAWTMPRATITLPGLDRDAAWRCTLRMRGARPAGLQQPQAAFDIAGETVAVRQLGPAYEEVVVEVPARPGSRGVTLTIRASPAFVPGPSDKRELGVQVDRIVWATADGSAASPPMRARGTTAVAGAAFGAVFTLLSTSLPVALAASALLALAVAILLNAGVAAYSAVYLGWIMPVALWITLPLLILASFRRFHAATGFVLGFSGAALFLKILALLHPSKELIDALFHAHRFQEVLAGNYYFTQPLPGGVRFPYAIGLYLAAVPWASLIRDHVVLLRIVVCVAEAVAAASIYLAVSRNWNDRLTAALALVLYHLAPLPYVVVGNANLTYAFGQSVAVITIALAATFALGMRNLPALAALFGAASLGFLSHVGIFPILGVTLVATGALYWFLGTRELRPTAVGIVVASVLAACFAVATYYAHFPEVYQTLARVTGGDAPSPAPEANAAALEASRAAPTIGGRALRAAALGVRAIGWPMLALAALGAWLIWRRRLERLSLSLAGAGLSFAVFVAFRVLAPVEPRYQRYADEFIDRVYYATLPAFAILAAMAAAWCWRAGGGRRIVGSVLVGASAMIGLQSWLSWVL
jgi:hypothetical protein